MLIITNIALTRAYTFMGGVHRGLVRVKIIEIDRIRGVLVVSSRLKGGFNLEVGESIPVHRLEESMALDLPGILGATSEASSLPRPGEREGRRSNEEG